MIDNLLKNIPIDKESEIFNTLFQNRTLKIERIVSNGQTSPEDFWYDQREDEFVILLEGKGVIEFESGELHILEKGDYLHIPAHTKHRNSYTDTAKPTVWLALFFTS